MEQQVDICFKREKNKKRRCCIDLVIFVISILLAFGIGLIIGALTGLVTFLGIGAIVLFLVTLLVLLIIRIIMLICCKKKECC